MDFLSPEQSATLTRGDFDEATFRRLVQQKGLVLQWSQSADCPCKPVSRDNGLDLTNIDDVDSGVGYTTECPVCKGRGFLYHSPQDVKAIVTSAEGDYLNARFGGYREGVINITLNPEHLPCFGDRFVLTQSVMLYRETVDVASTDNQALRFPIADRNLVLRNGPGTFNVIYAHATDPATGLTLVDGELTPGVDFNVINGEISWVNRPASGTRVSFTYFINPTYTVVSYPNSIRDTNIITKRPVDTVVPMLVRVQAKLDFLEAE